MTEQHITHEETLHYTKEAAGQVRAARVAARVGAEGGAGGRLRSSAAAYTLEAARQVSYGWGVI